METGAKFEPEMDGMSEIGTSGTNTVTLLELVGAPAAKTNPPAILPELPSADVSGAAGVIDPIPSPKSGLPYPARDHRHPD